MAYTPKDNHIDKQITYRHMKATPAMEEYVNDRLAKIEHFLETEKTPIYLHLVLDAENTHHHHRVELSIKSPNYEIFTECEGPELYLAIDTVIDSASKRLHEDKKQLVEKRQTGFSRE